MKTEPLTTTMIETLMSEADSAGDEQMAEICAAALRGDQNARMRCATAITGARAMNDEVLLVVVA